MLSENDINYIIDKVDPIYKNEVKQYLKEIKANEADLNKILTVSEAAEIWGKDVSNLRKEFRSGKRFVEGKDIRKSATTWLVTRNSMIENYGEIEI